MKLNETENPDLVEDEIGDFESMDAEISQDDPGFIYELFSKRLYSNPEGSIVREITSNCFDAHTAAGKFDEPVPIKLYREEGQYWFAFRDEGTGMTPTIIKTVYMKYLKSTKRHSNDFIGAYGLGSKSPLAYSDFFYLTTRVDGMEWQYMLHKTPKAPRLELLLQLDTDQPNGTIVRVPIKDEDVDKFKAETLRQLFYFTNVYVEGIYGFDNHYTVYDFKTFKYRPMPNYNEDWYKEMHIIVDKVTYPIDWNALKMPAIKVSIGLKFNIGDLEIPPHRESIGYTAESIVLIKKRIEEARAELTAIANNDRSKTCLTISDYNAKMELLVKNELLAISMNDDNVMLKIRKNDSTPQTPFFISQVASFRWKPLAHLPISFKETPFFEYSVLRQIGELGTMKKMKNNMSSYLTAPNGKKLVFVENGEQPGRIKNYQLGSGTYVVSRSKRIYKHRGKSDAENTFWDGVIIEGIKNAKNTPYTFNGMNKSFLMREYRKIIAAELSRFCPNYKDIVVTEQTRTSYRSHFDHRVKREKGIIPAIYAAPDNAKHDKDSRVDIDTTLIELYKGIVIYGTKDQYISLRDIAEILGKKNTTGYRSVRNDSLTDEANKDAYVFATSDRAIDKFLKPFQKLQNNIFSYEQVLAGECQYFNTICLKHLLAERIKKSTRIPSDLKNYEYTIKKVNFFNTKTCTSLLNLLNFKNQWSKGSMIETLLSGDQIKVITAKTKPFVEIEDLKKCEEYFGDLQLLYGHSNIELDRDKSYVRDLVSYLQFKGKTLNDYLNITLTDDEKKWRDDLRVQKKDDLDAFKLTAPPRLAPFLDSDPLLKNFIF